MSKKREKIYRKKKQTLHATSTFDLSVSQTTDISKIPVAEYLSLGCHTQHHSLHVAEVIKREES